MLAPQEGWQPIETAPKKTEILVGRFRNKKWIFCQSGFYYDAGDWEGSEKPYWYWHCDHDKNGVTDEDPTHWMPLPEPPDVSA